MLPNTVAPLGISNPSYTSALVVACGTPNGTAGRHLYEQSQVSTWKLTRIKQENAPSYFLNECAQEGERTLVVKRRQTISSDDTVEFCLNPLENLREADCSYCRDIRTVKCYNSTLSLPRHHLRAGSAYEDHSLDLQRRNNQ